MVRRLWIPAALILILAAGALFRFTGINWDQDQHQHPDERFVTMVAERIRPVAGLAEYFDTETSTLNPLGYGFYTYGMWPLFLTRYVAEWVDHTSYDQIVLVGRVLSGLFDLASVLVLYLLGARLYGRRTGLLAAGLYAAAVLPIQLAHFFAVDSFTTLFTIVALYAAVLVMEGGRWWAFVLFGMSAGLAIAAKVSMAPLAGLVVVAGLAYLLQARSNRAELIARLREVLGGWLLAAFFTFWVFRILQPYAFLGPGIFGLRLNPRWLQIVREVSDQVAGRSDFPPNHHWAGRPFSYGWSNMVLWGLGLPLGLAATAAWGWTAWRTWKGDWQRHLLLVLWVGAFLVWQSTNFWRYTRYYLPIYPFAILLAAWALVELLRRARRTQTAGQRATLSARLTLLLLASIVLATYTYAYAFTRIYTRPHTRVAASRWMLQNLPGPVNLVLETAEGTRQIPLPMPGERVLKQGQPWTASFTPPVSGTVTAVTAPHVRHEQEGDSTAVLQVALTRGGAAGQLLAAASTDLESARGSDAGSHSQALEVDLEPVVLGAGQKLALTLSLEGGGSLAFSGTAIAVESSWDDVLPLPVDDRTPYSGLYRLLDLELHEADTEPKRQQMLDLLDQADYIVVASNRSYDAMPRLPLRFPMTAAFYRALFGCDAGPIADCAYAATAPLQGDLGFDLVATFESYPTLGPLSIPDQTAQESFTVYDHPRVLLFKKTATYSPARTRGVLEAVDLSQVIEQTAIQVSQAPTGLRLPAARLAAQKVAGTWGTLFAPSSPLNRSQPLAALAWLLLLLVTGWIVFPVAFVAFSGLSDRGYALARMVGLLIVAWLAWFVASNRIAPFTVATLWLCLALVGVLSGFIAWRSRAALYAFLRARWRHILFVEGLFLALFLLGLVLRLSNPDLWHPWRGGEKPGDLAMLSAVLKSTYFPPYDPWLSGNYVNYYYFGYVLAAVPTKMLGIAPAVAYNLLIPTWFALTGLGAFAVAHNLAAGRPHARGSRSAYLAGLAALVLMAILGNLYEFQLLVQRLSAGGVDLLAGDAGPWYFDASRAILNGNPAAPITEFPFFTVLYADLHPHLLDMPIVLAALAWLLSTLLAPVLLSRTNFQKQKIALLATWLLGGLLLGATYPTNTWDFPVLAGLAAVVVGYTTWSNAAGDAAGDAASVWRAKMERLCLHVAVLLALSVALYAPFRQWFAAGTQGIQRWTGPRTPLSDYLTVHGLFLFLLATYLALETARWLRPRVDRFMHTPLGEMVPALKRAGAVLLIGLPVLLVGFIWAWNNDYQSVALSLPLVLWAGLLLLRRDQTPNQRFALLLVASGIGLTLIAELVTLKGDVGRMNIVFKLYLLVWIFFSITAGAALVWIRARFGSDERRWLWWGSLIFLVVAAGTYPVIGSLARARDRWPDVANPPQTLDGMAYMLGDRADSSVAASAGNTSPSTSAIYVEADQALRLADDYEALRWMQANVPGTPTIVEGHTPEYRWGARFSAYTGLPTIVGWSWHLRQHNAVLPDSVVEKRIAGVAEFYNTPSRKTAREFLERYGVDYIIVGDLERARYSAEGLEKFSQMVAEGDLDLVYPPQAADGGTRIYAVQMDQ